MAFRFHPNSFNQSFMATPLRPTPVRFLLWLVLISFLLVQCKKTEDTPVSPKSSAKSLDNPTIEGINSATATYEPTTKSYTMTTPGGTDLTTLKLMFTLSAGAIAKPVSGSVQNFKNPVTYTVTAEDGSTQVYTIKVVYKSTWATQLERDIAFQNWVAKVSGKTVGNATFSVINGTGWPYGLSNELVAFAINESGLAPGLYDVTTNPGGYQYESFLKVNRWLSAKPFIGPDGYVVQLFLAEDPSKKTVSASFSYALDDTSSKKLTVLPANRTNASLPFLLGIYTY